MTEQFIPGKILLMEEILHHLAYIKPCKYWDIDHINRWTPDFFHQQYGHSPSSTRPQCQSRNRRQSLWCRRCWTGGPGSSKIALSNSLSTWRMLHVSWGMLGWMLVFCCWKYLCKLVTSLSILWSELVVLDNVKISFWGFRPNGPSSNLVNCYSSMRERSLRMGWRHVIINDVRWGLPSLPER